MILIRTPPCSAESGKTPYFINLANQGSLTSNIFGVFQARNGASGSELCLGCTDSAHYSGSESLLQSDLLSPLLIVHSCSKASATTLCPLPLLRELNITGTPLSVSLYHSNDSIANLTLYYIRAVTSTTPVEAPLELSAPSSTPGPPW